MNLKRRYYFQIDSLIRLCKHLAQYLALSGLFARLLVKGIFLILAGLALGMDCNGFLHKAQ